MPTGPGTMCGTRYASMSSTSTRAARRTEPRELSGGGGEFRRKFNILPGKFPPRLDFPKRTGGGEPGSGSLVAVARDRAVSARMGRAVMALALGRRDHSV